MDLDAFTAVNTPHWERLDALGRQRRLTGAEAEEIVRQFANAAAAAKRIGFDAVEVMASEGYLINQFCSPVTNLRDDEWGGDQERRERFAIQVVRAVCEAVGELPVTVRIPGDDLMPSAPTPEQYARLAVRLAAEGADAISVGIGWHESRVPTVQASVHVGPVSTGAPSTAPLSTGSPSTAPSSIDPLSIAPLSTPESVVVPSATAVSSIPVSEVPVSEVVVSGSLPESSEVPPVSLSASALVALSSSAAPGEAFRRRRPSS